MNVKHKAVSSTLWTVTRIVLDQFFSFFVFVVVARILGPADVGLFALGMIVAELGRIFSTSGFGDVVTKASREEEDEVALAAFWGNMAMSVASVGILCAIAWPAALLVDSPRLAPVVIALAFTVPISAGYAIHQARQLKRFGHKSLAIRSLVAGVIGGAVAVAAAYAGAGVWALVIQRVVTEVISLIAIWLSYRWVPSLRLSWPRIREIFPFSAQMSLSKLTGVIMTRFQDIVIGAYVNAAAVGVYRVAKRTIDMMVTGALTSFSSVALQLFANVREDEARLRSAVIRVIAISATAAFPIFVGVAVVADDLIPIVYGPKWRESVALLQLLTPVAVPTLFSLLSLSVLTIYGESRSVSKVTAIQFTLTVVLSLLSAPFGVEAVILAFLARCYLVMPYQLHLVARHVGCGWGPLVMAMARPLLAALIMGLAAYALLYELQILGVWPLARVGIVAIAGGIIYGALLWTIDRQSLIWLIELARGYAGRKSRAAA